MNLGLVDMSEPVRNLTDRIEQYLKQLLEQNVHGTVEIQRHELAATFDCAPSQINYVLSTRFTAEQGYLVESRRGGGGYLRIIKLSLDEDETINKVVTGAVGDRVTQQVGEGLIRRLLEEGIVSSREAILMKAAMDRETLQLELPKRDRMRARLLKAMLLAIMREDFR